MLNNIMDFLKLLLFAIVLLFIISFSFVNTDVIKIKIIPFFYEVETRVFLAVIFSFILGFLFGTFLNIIKSVKNILANMKIEKRVKKLEQELDEKK